MRSISVVVPVYNEEKTVPELIKRLFASLGAHAGFRLHEIIFVDDGSRDRTFEQLKEAARRDPRIKILSFSRNFGHQIAVSAGLDQAGGDAAVIIDGDLQDPPEVIPELVAKWEEGYDIVYAVRRERKEHILKRACYALFYRLLKTMAEVDIPLDTGDFSLIDRKVVEVITAMPEHSRFIRGLRAWSGFKAVGVEYERAGRFAGKTKYTFRKLVGLAANGIIGFSTLPLQLATYVGFFMAGASFVIGIVILCVRLWFGSIVLVPGFTSIMLSIFFVGGVQIVIIGIIGEYIGRIYKEVQGRPIYIVREKVGFTKKP